MSADETARIAHLRALRALEHARAKKRIDDLYDARERGDLPPQISRRVFDRRNADLSWGGQTNTLQRGQSDMSDINLHLDADTFRDAHIGIEP